MLKPLTVWITTNWKILKEMRIPDHLTCFLRSLYAELEATVRTRQDWLKIGKGAICERKGIVVELGRGWIQMWWSLMRPGLTGQSILFWSEWCTSEPSAPILLSLQLWPYWESHHLIWWPWGTGSWRLSAGLTAHWGACPCLMGIQVVMAPCLPDCPPFLTPQNLSYLPLFLHLTCQ